MKKGRSGSIIQVIAKPEESDAIARKRMRISKSSAAFLDSSDD